ncbi:sugar MFS transporter [Flavitalea sp.]|nr:sugar MFS transporter [Flavitalea sp.]
MNATTNDKKGSSSIAKPLYIIGILFFIFGFITWVSSVLIPYLQIACQLNNFQAFLVAFAFYISYLFMAVPSGWLLQRVGYKKGMVIGLWVMAIGAFLFIPAAQTRMYGIFLLGLFLQGSGMAILQTASNPYVTILGPLESAAKRISLMGICSGVAGAIAPIILGAIVLSDADLVKEKLSNISGDQNTEVLNELAHRVEMPYLITGIILLSLSFLIGASGLPEIDSDIEDKTLAIANEQKKSIFQFPHLLLGVLALFLYVGVEVIAGNTIITYAQSQGIPMSTAKFFTSATLIGMLVGYIIGIIAIPKYIAQQNALKICSLLGITFGLGALFTNGIFSITFIAMLGLANSLIWPSIWPMAIAGLGRFTKIGSSLLIMAIGGGAFLPLFYGFLTDYIGAKQAYWMLLPCYLVIYYYSVHGHKIRNTPVLKAI